MKRKWTFIGCLLVVLLLALTIGAGQAQGPELQREVSAQAVLGTAFTYQGQLQRDGNLVNGTCDFQFSLWNAASGGAQVGTTQTKTNVSVSNGYFTIPDLDFGAGIFQGDARWLAVAVRCPAGSGSYTTLSPRQALTAAPYALGLRPGAVINDANSNLELNRYVAGTISRKYGVYAKAQGASINVGVYGEAGNDIDDVGVAGYSPNGWGVYGESGHASGFGVFGYNNIGAGVYGRTSSGRGVYGEATATSGTTYGVYGESASTSGDGVFGYATATSGETYGVYGRTNSTEGMGVFGRAAATSGTNYGVYGRSDSPSGVGVYGKTTATGNCNACGLYGKTNCLQGSGVYGYGAVGVEARSPGNYGVFAHTEVGWGVWGASSGTNGVGVAGIADNGWAGFFYGKVRVNGALEKYGGGFKIDHPLDPANKYLNHSFVESPDMKNVYDGVVTLDANGEAVVELPAWFEALNRDFRYQLTCIGGYAPVYIAAEIQDNRFKIAGGKPGLKVSWQVTGIRQDPWANDHRIPVEEAKAPDEQGTYLYPEGFGQPKEMGLDYQRTRDARERMENNTPLTGGGE